MTNKPYNIFISWSGPRSKHVAQALNEWLPTVLQSARPWFSTLSIDKGARPLEEIAKALDTIEVGISCLTPENLTAPWVLYEAGALSKRIGQKSRLCTFLLGGLSPEGVAPPLGMFQHTRGEKDDSKQMLKAINNAINEDPVPEPALDKLFERMWPDLEQSIKTMPAPEGQVPEERPLKDMVVEILDMMRGDRSARAAEAARVRAEAWEDAVVEQLATGTGKAHRSMAALRDWLSKEREQVVDPPNCPNCGSSKVERSGVNKEKATCLDCKTIYDAPLPPKFYGR